LIPLLLNFHHKAKVLMNSTPEYGRCLDNPIQLNSIPGSIIFLNNLVTEEGLHLLYHRYGSIPFMGNSIDHYEVMASNNKYDDFFINVYNENSVWIPPVGYLFEAWPEDMCEQLISRENIFELDEEDIIGFDDKYIFQDHVPDDLEKVLEQNQLLPPLERALLSSFGTNSFLENFPYDLIDILPIKSYISNPAKLEEITSSIIPRGKRPEFLLDALSRNNE